MQLFFEEITDAEGNITYLRISADEPTRQFLKELSNYAERDVFVQTAINKEENCKYVFVRAEYVGALTESPILVPSDKVFVNNDGDMEIENDAYAFWFPDYMVRDSWEELIRIGYVDFKKEG